MEIATTTITALKFRRGIARPPGAEVFRFRDAVVRRGESGRIPFHSSSDDDGGASLARSRSPAFERRDQSVEPHNRLRASIVLAHIGRHAALARGTILQQRD